MTTFWMVLNCLSVSSTSVRMAASVPTPAEVSARQNLTVAVPGSLLLPFLLSVSMKSLFPDSLDVLQVEVPLSDFWTCE